MNQIEKDTIQYLRLEGLKHRDIADQLGMTEDSVKGCCRRNNFTEALDDTCRHCGGELRHTAGHRKKKYCSDACRLAWWNARPHLMNRAAVYTATCAHCGQQFESYGNKHRKYYGHVCYIQDRFGKGKEHGKAAV